MSSADRPDAAVPDAALPEVARLEVFVEPFEEANPGPHVAAAVEAMESAGVSVDLGALASTADGGLDEVLDAAVAMLRATFEAGATAVQLRVERN